MRIFDFFKAKKANSAECTASLAKERLQLVIAHQKADERSRMSILTPQMLSQLQTELLAVVAKYVKIKDDALNIKHSVEDGASLIELSVCFDERESDNQIRGTDSLRPSTKPEVAASSATSNTPKDFLIPRGDIGRLSEKFTHQKAF